MNWGNKLLLTFVVFGSGMSYLVYRAMHTEFELVEKDYYKTELQYQKVIDASKRTAALDHKVSFEQNREEIKIIVPTSNKGDDIKGNVWFYCAYDSHNDRKFDLKPDSLAAQSFSKNKIRPGQYIVKTSWSAGGESYYSEDKLEVN
jgi:nitrogen fixation protein FixH